MNLIIVESPTKARTFNRILKEKDFYVFATFGHIRDLPVNKIAINYKEEFKPDYRVIQRRKKIVSQLKTLAKKNQKIILATDPDREGESIAYHVAYLLGFIKEKWPEFVVDNKKQRLVRIVFHEITSSALKEALAHPSQLREDLVKAQQARRILDRIVGYELSPLLWKKTGKNWLSAGRVQTVALRLIIEREKEIENFKKEKYYQIYGFFQPIKAKSSPDDRLIKAKLIKKDDIVYEQIFKLKLLAGEYQYIKTTINDENINSIVSDLNYDQFQLFDIKEAIINRYPPPPLTTSLLQQEGFNKFGFSSKLVMKLAQDLYEHGLITYHRTDSFSLATSFVFGARDFIKRKYGEKFVPEKPRGYKTKSKSAQEAHEAIRPTDLDKNINEQSSLTVNHKRLYGLIFNRAVACQMKEAAIKQIKFYIKSQKNYLFEETVQQVLFPGFLIVLNLKFLENNRDQKAYSKNGKLLLNKLEAKENYTQPPPRYNEASLIKTLEEKGIGRPSTYAPIISLIQEKNYVIKDNRYFVPTAIGRAIINYLMESFSELFDINFTAKMEEGLDNIANHQEKLTELLEIFYQPFNLKLKKEKETSQFINIEEKVEDKCPLCGKNLVIRYSKYGKFYACSGYPQCKYTKPYRQILADKKCPKCGGEIVIKFTKSRKRFYGCANYPKCNYSSWKKPN